MSCCLMCNRTFASQKALKIHYQRQPECYNNFLKYGLQVSLPDSPQKQLTSHTSNELDSMTEFTFDNNENSDNENAKSNIDSLINKYNFNNTKIDHTLKERYDKHLKSGNDGIIESNLLMQSQIDLLVILNQAQAPLYLYDQIWKWTQQSAEGYKINFGSINNMSREKCIKVVSFENLTLSLVIFSL